MESLEVNPVGSPNNTLLQDQGESQGSWIHGTWSSLWSPLRRNRQPEKPAGCGAPPPAGSRGETQLGADQSLPDLDEHLAHGEFRESYSNGQGRSAYMHPENIPERRGPSLENSDRMYRGRRPSFSNDETTRENQPSTHLRETYVRKGNPYPNNSKAPESSGKGPFPRGQNNKASEQNSHSKIPQNSKPENPIRSFFETLFDQREMDTELDWIESYLLRNQTNKNIVKIKSESSAPAVGEGANFLSIVNRNKITVWRQSGKKERISVIVKKKPIGEGRAAFLQETGAFKKEIMVFTQVLKEMENLMAEHDDHAGKLWGELIGYHPYDCLVFEDLSVQGFRLTDSRHDFLDLDHSLVVMQALGRLHALSKVLTKKSLIERSDFATHFLVANPKTTETVMGHCLNGFGKHLKSWGKEWEEVGDILCKYSGNIHNVMAQVGETSINSNLVVMNHGDVWTCNLLFKYARYSQKPIDVRFVDFQLCHYNTAGWDLTYFMYGSINPEVRRNNYDLLLQVYIQEMKTTAALYDLPSKEIPDIKDLKADMDRLLPYRLIVTFFFRPLFVSRYPFEIEAVMTNFDKNESIGQNVKMLSDPNYKEKSLLDLKEIASMLKKFKL